MNTKNPPALPVVLEVAALPREQVGPFLLLGVGKTADREEIEAHWAQRLIWARKNQIKVPLEDINWAREMLSDSAKRARADAASFNVDTADEVLARLQERYRSSPDAARPLDVEKPLADYSPAIELPSIDEVKQSIPLPQVAAELPALQQLLREFVQQPIDPWEVGEW